MVKDEARKWRQLSIFPQTRNSPFHRAEIQKSNQLRQLHRRMFEEVGSRKKSGVLLLQTPTLVPEVLQNLSNLRIIIFSRYG